MVFERRAFFLVNMLKGIASVYPCAQFVHRAPEHLISNRNECAVILIPVFQCIFQLFRRDLNEAKAVNINRLSCAAVMKPENSSLRHYLTVRA